MANKKPTLKNLEERISKLERTLGDVAMHVQLNLERKKSILINPALPSTPQGHASITNYLHEKSIPYQFVGGTPYIRVPNYAVGYLVDGGFNFTIIQKGSV